jgi:autotransporter-associated beta strand protein
VTVQAAGEKRTVHNEVKLSSAVTIAGNQPLTFSGRVTEMTGIGTLDLIVTDQQGAFFTNVIRNEKGGGLHLIKKGAGKLVLAGENAYGGETTLEEGELVVGNDKALGTSKLVIKGGTFSSLYDNKELARPGQVFTLANEVVLAGDARIGGRHPLVLTGQVALEKNITLTVSNTAAVTFANAIGQRQKGLAFTKAGDGVLILAGKNAYTGTTTVEGGVLEVNGALHGDSKVMVKPNGTLAGTGEVGVVEDEGTVRPGPAMGRGTLHIDRLTFSGARSKYTAVLRPKGAGTGHGDGDVSGGAVDLSKTELVLDRGEKFTVKNVGDRVPLLRARDGIKGVFMNQPKGSQVTVNGQVFDVLYEAKAVVLKRVK